MRIFSSRLAIPVLMVTAVLATSGCALLKKKKKTFDDTPTPTDTVLEPPAVNRADLTRFSDEVLVHGQADFIRQITFAKTAPDDGGTTVGVIDPDTAVLKWSLRNGNTLITFDRQAFPGKRFAGWVKDSSFTANVAAGATGTGTAKTGLAGVGTSTVGGTPPSTGQCTLSLRSTSFSPSTPTCSFNEKVRAGSPATMTFPCGGGAATARFATQTFTGTADPKTVSLANVSTFPFQGCQVQATQRIFGAVPNLSYTYSERIVSGTCKGVSTCTASGRVSAF